MHIYLNIIFNHFYNPNSMKNMFKTLAAVAMIALAASCSKDAAEAPAVVDETAKVSFTVELPGVVSRATNDGTTATELHYAVYQDNGDNTNTLLFSTDAEDQVKTMSDLATTVELDLVSQQTYDIVFWAQAPGAYDPDFAAKSVAMNYDSNKVGSNEARDAFVYVWNNLTVNGSINEKVELRRPFAQLNVALTDGQIEAAQKAGFTLDQVKVSAKTHNAFGFFAAEQGAPVGEMINIEFTAADYELTPNTIEVNNVDYDWVSFNYLLACTPSELVDVNITFLGEQNKSIEVPAFTNVPIERNHRTNIVGDLLTDPAKFEVVILPGFEDDDKYGVNNGQTYIKVYNADEFNAAFTNSNYDLIILAEDIVLTESLTRAAADPVLMVKKGKELTIDLNGKKLSSTSTETGKNYNMFDVRGTLTVKNGTMEYEHKGTNMNWNNSTNLFNVTDGGVLNIEGVTAKNLGGSDMAFVAHLNNWGEVTLNVENSTLESTYIAVRVFNSGNDMNNVTIKNSTLNGKYCFWVHNYTVADFGTQEKADAHAALLNFDFWNVANDGAGDSNNTFTFSNSKDAPVLYGFTNAIYFDEFGVEIPQLIPIAGAEGVAYDPASAVEENGETVYKTIVVTANEGLAWVASNVAANNGFAGKTIVLDTDVDLAEVKTMGNSFAPIGSTGERDDRNRLICEPFKGTFDGNGKTISNLSQSGWDFGYEWGQYGSIGLFSELEGATVKNVVLEGFDCAIEGGDIAYIAGSATGDCVFEDIEIKSGGIGTYNNGIGSIIGWSGAGNYTFKNIKIGEDVVLGGLWGSFDSSVGGMVGQAEPGASYHFEDVEINCRLDVYNDVTAAYKYYIYRMSGMIIGRCEATTTIDGRNYPDLSKYNITCKNVTVNYGDWMNYHYCVVEGKTAWRHEPGYAYDGIPADHDHSTCAMHHNLCLPFDGLFGGDQYGVNPIKEYPGVTVNYPASYTPEN